MGSKRTVFWASFTSMTLVRISKLKSTSRPLRCSAWTSLGKQLPPYPMPGNRKRGPMRVSVPMPRRTLSTSAPTFSQKFAISFMNVILVARKLFAAYFVNSALRSSITMSGFPWRMNGL